MPVCHMGFEVSLPFEGKPTLRAHQCTTGDRRFGFLSGNDQPVPVGYMRLKVSFFLEGKPTLRAHKNTLWDRRFGFPLQEGRAWDA